MATLHETRARARADLHAKAALAASYQPPGAGPVVPVSVRVHQGARLVRQGGGEFESLELDDDSVSLVFARAELSSPEIGAVVTITETAEQFRIARLLGVTPLETRVLVERV